MNIIFGRENAEQIDDRYVVLQLDTVLVGDQPVTAFCLVEKVSLQDLSNLGNLRDLHQKLMKNYLLQNWSFCGQALEHLIGKWNGELDSFYTELSQRIAHLESQDLDPDWDGIYRARSASM